MNEDLTTDELEDKKKESLKSHMRMYISSDFAEILKRMDDIDGISNDLLTISKRNVQFDISFIDKTDKNDEITFILTRRVLAMEEKGMDIKNARNNYNSEIWKSTQRDNQRIGRFVRKIFGDKYTSAQYERFVNEYKAKFEKKDDKMVVVYGEDIRKYYLHTHYAAGNGVLGGSCMRGEDKQKFLDIYVENTPGNDSLSHCGMLVLFDDNKKILGRSIIWFNTIKPDKLNRRVFMDRIYTNNDHDVNTFINYARQKGWLYKQQQTYNNASYIDPNDGSRHRLTISVRLKPKEYKYYPFLDTMVYYTPKTGRLATTQGIYSKLNQMIKIQSTDGGHTNL